MSNQLRRGIEKIRRHYINRLVKHGIYQEADPELHSLTLSELKAIVKKSLPRQN